MPPSSGRGSALLMVLWAMILMSVVVLGLVELVTLNQDEFVARARDFRALQLAECGLAVGLHPNVEDGDEVLKQPVAPGEKFEVRLTSEGARLQINHLLATNQRAILIALFEKWGVPSADAGAAVDCLSDWVDADDLEHLNGAERDDYTAVGRPGYPPNRPFRSVEEMALVRGMDIVAAKKPDWDTCFTIWSDGKLDVNEASAELIEVVCGVTPQQAEALVSRRWGSDGKPGTDDDFRYKDLNQVRLVLGMADPDFQLVAGRLTLQDPTRRIESTGIVGEYRKTLMVVVRRNVNPPQYLAWLER
ncbi:MAG: general secretion pathway protein GspK [Verrucomicrobia bacterium]|nr:general secretion pathway protein GspK [Verrucomicrobiota bacterium]